jgi:hypothetical protein
MTYIKGIPKHLPEGTKKNHEIIQDSISRLNVETDTV